MVDAVTARRFLVVLTGAFVLLSACEVEIDVATEVDEEGSGEMAVTLLLGETVRETFRNAGLPTDDPEELRKLIEEGGTDALRREKLPNPVDTLEATVPPGWTSERFQEAKAQGLRLVAEFESLEEIPELIAPFDDWGDEIAARRGSDADEAAVGAVLRGFSLTRQGEIFRFRAEPDMSAYEGAEGGANRLRAEFTISMKLPGGVREHDADEKEEGALVWHIAPGTSRTISATSDLGYNPTDFPTVPVAVGGSVAGLVGLLALRHLRERRRGGGRPPGPDVPDSEPVPV